MADIDRIDHRLAAVERAVIDGDYEVDELGDLATLTETVERLEARVDEQERRLAALEAKTESLTGFVDTVESVNDDVERQAATAVATVDRLEDRIDELESALEAVRPKTADAEAGAGRSKASTDGDSDLDAGRRNAASASTEVTFSERETAASDDGASTPEHTVSGIVGGGDGDADSDFEWGAEESAADGSAAESPASGPGAAGTNAAEQESVDRSLANSSSDRSESATDGTAAADADDGKPSDSDGLLSSVRSKLP